MSLSESLLAEAQQLSTSSLIGERAEFVSLVQMQQVGIIGGAKLPLEFSLENPSPRASAA